MVPSRASTSATPPAGVAARSERRSCGTTHGTSALTTRMPPGSTPSRPACTAAPWPPPGSATGSAPASRAAVAASSSGVTTRVSPTEYACRKHVAVHRVRERPADTGRGMEARLPLRARERDHDGDHAGNYARCTPARGDTPAVTIAATQRFPGPAWDELPEVTLLERWPPAHPLPGVDVLLEAVVPVGGGRARPSCPISASSRTTASATTTSTSPPAASVGSR